MVERNFSTADASDHGNLSVGQSNDANSHPKTSPSERPSWAPLTASMQAAARIIDAALSASGYPISAAVLAGLLLTQIWAARGAVLFFVRP